MRNDPEMKCGRKFGKSAKILQESLEGKYLSRTREPFEVSVNAKTLPLKDTGPDIIFAGMLAHFLHLFADMLYSWNSEAFCGANASGKE